MAANNINAGLVGQNLPTNGNFLDNLNGGNFGGANNIIAGGRGGLTQQQLLQAVNAVNAAQRNARLNPNPAAGNGMPMGNGGGGNGNGNGIDPFTAAMLGMGQFANAGASMWDASQNGLASIANTDAMAQLQSQLGTQALNNQAQLYKNNLALGQGTLSNQRDLTMAGYQNRLDSIKAMLGGLQPLVGSFTSGLGNAFGGMGNLLGGSMAGAGGLSGFQSSNGVAAQLPGGGGNATYNTGISTSPAMSPADQQANVNSLAATQTTSAPGMLSSQTTPAQRSTLASMMAQRSAQSSNQAATNLDRYQQAAAAKLGYDQQAQNSQASNALQGLLNHVYGSNLNRDLQLRQANQQGVLGRLNATSNLMGGLLSGAGGLLGGIA